MNINKTKQSALIFNTPAVHACHGWKLAEFLAMGKAILSIPLKNKLQPSLIDGNHFHLVHDPEKLSKALDELLENNEYRNKLEKMLEFTMKIMLVLSK